MTQSRLRWVTDDGIQGRLLTVSVIGATPSTTLRWVTDDGLEGETVTVSVLQGSTTATVRWVTDDGVLGEPITVTVNDTNPNPDRTGTGSLGVSSAVTGRGNSGNVEAPAEPLEVTAALSGSGTKAIIGNGDLIWYGELTGEGLPDLPPVGQGTINAGTVDLAGEGVMGAEGTWQIDVTATITGDSFEGSPGEIDVVGEVSGSGAMGCSGTGGISGESSLSAVGTIPPEGGAYILSNGNLGATGTKGGEGDGDIDVPNPLAGVGIKAGTGTASISGDIDLIFIGEKARWVFKPPTVDEPWPRLRPHRFWDRITIPRGITVLKEGDSYRQTRDPSAEEVDLADITYLGGYRYEVEDEEALALQAAGYGAYLTTPGTS